MTIMKQTFHRTMRHLLGLILCLSFSASAMAQDEPNPVADPAAVVTSGNVRFTVLTDRMIRIQYSSTATFEDRATFAIVNRRLPVPQYTTETKDGYLYIYTDRMTLRYKVGSVPNAKYKNTNSLKITFSMNGQTCTWYPGKDDALNLLGTTRTLDRAWGDTQRDRLENGLLSRAGWSIIDESPTATRGDGSTSYPMEKNSDGFMWWQDPADQNAIDWYFLGYGHDYKDCLSDYIRVGGRVPLPPKYIFGYWYSRYWAYSTNDFKQIIRDVERNDIPMDVLIMDMDWHRSGWTGWSWNTALIPNPAALITYMHNHGLRTALNLHPADGIGSHEDQYAAMKADLGYDASHTGTIPWAIEDYTFTKAFFKNIIRPHEEKGVDFWWIDWQQHLLVDGMTLGETFWCNHTFFEDMRMNRPDVRPVIYHRWGGLGSHRYPICFSGDTYAAWSTLAYEIFFTSTASNVCYDYWGHDIGGHQGGDNDPELYLRWLQFGAYTPIFRTHATNDSKLERRIWKYNNFTQLREAVRLRYRLFPYLYTMARETYDTGIGMNRPLYYDYPEESNAYVYEDEYMFGNDMLVAPIYTPAKNGYSTRRIWLPAGEWWDVTNNRMQKGDCVFDARFTLDQFPVYYKSGAIIPNYPVQRTVVDTPEEIVLHVAPGESGTGSLYEDNGNNSDYIGSAWARTVFTQTRTAEGISLQIGARNGTYEGIPETRTWNIQFLGTPDTYDAEQITVNGTPVDATQISYDADTQCLSVLVPVTDLSQALNIYVPLKNTDVAENNSSEIDYNEGSQTVSVQLPPTAEKVTLTITSLIGVEVCHLEAQDVRSLSASMAGIPSGVYVCKAKAGKVTLTKKIIKK